MNVQTVGTSLAAVIKDKSYGLYLLAPIHLHHMCSLPSLNPGHVYQNSLDNHV